MADIDGKKSLEKVIKDLKDALAFMEPFKEEYIQKLASAEKLEELEAKYSKTKEGLQQVASELEKTSKELNQVSKEKEELEEKIKKIEKENFEMKEELEHISEEMKKVTSEFEHLQKEKDKRVEMREILALSMTLLTEVFGAQPHSKIMFLLHGFPAGKEIDRKALTKSSGLAPASVRKSLADLAAAKLIEFDVETDKVKLLKKIY
ncbi:MAG: hypothetical protein ACTSVY_13325 [Candidatus Helarchaeota archaeon]